MKALLVVRPDAATRPGGDLVHADRTARALRELGVEATIRSASEPDARGCDVAHVFGIFEPETARRQIDALRAQRTPLVISPIWLDLRELFTVGRKLDGALSARTPRGVAKRLEKLRRDEARLPWTGRAARDADRRVAAQSALARRADVLIAGSEVEAYLYGARLRAGDLPIVVAHLGADTVAAEPGDGERDAVQAAVERVGVLCAARIEPKKNQAALLYALREVDVDVTLVGDAYDAAYLALCRRWATPRTRILPHAAHEDVRRMMRDARVHAHPSWLETPGLASLEAASAGARVVAGDRGCEREYFGADADYADPSDPASIRTAVMRALERPPRAPGDALALRLRERTWRRHAEASLEAYERAIATARRAG